MKHCHKMLCGYMENGQTVYQLLVGMDLWSKQQLTYITNIRNYFDPVHKLSIDKLGYCIDTSGISCKKM